MESGEPLLLEIKAFLDSVRTRTPPRVTAQQARDALALALEINQAIQAHADPRRLLGLTQPSVAASSASVPIPPPQPA